MLHEMFAAISHAEDVLGVYPDFRVRVLACKSSPTHSVFEGFTATTEAVVNRLLRKESLGRTRSHLTLVFPERYLSPEQERCFMNMLAECNCAKTGAIQFVDIVTKSPVILTDFTADMIRTFEITE